MKIYDRVHQLRIQFNVTPEIARYVYVYIIMGKEGCYLVDTGVKGCDKKLGNIYINLEKQRKYKCCTVDPFPSGPYWCPKNHKGNVFLLRICQQGRAGLD